MNQFILPIEGGFIFADHRDGYPRAFTLGYIFAGTYGVERNNPRNLFVLTFDENLTACSNPVYLTSYTRNDGHAGHPKIVSILNMNDTFRYNFHNGKVYWAVNDSRSSFAVYALNTGGKL
jgi:hypothetical protein